MRNKVLNANDFFDNQRNIASCVLPLPKTSLAPTSAGRLFRTSYSSSAAMRDFGCARGTLQTYVPTDAGARRRLFTSWVNQHLFAVHHLRSDDERQAGNPACDGSNAVCRTAFPGNIIPAGPIDPTAQALLSLLPGA